MSMLATTSHATRMRGRHMSGNVMSDQTSCALYRRIDGIRWAHYKPLWNKRPTSHLSYLLIVRR
jgi:hypothetical protein